MRWQNLVGFFIKGSGKTGLRLLTRHAAYAIR